MYCPDTYHRLNRRIVFGTWCGDYLYTLNIIRLELMQFVDIPYLTVIDINKRSTFGKHTHRAIRTDINARYFAQNICCGTYPANVGVLNFHHHTLTVHLYILTHGVNLYAFQIYRALMQHYRPYHTSAVCLKCGLISHATHPYYGFLGFAWNNELPVFVGYATVYQ